MRGLAIAVFVVPLVLMAAPSQAGRPDPVVRWESALGDAAARARWAAGAHLEGTSIAEGLSGETEAWIASTGYRVVTAQGGRTSERVDAPGHSWRRDWNGWVRGLEGRDARDAATDAFLHELVLGGFSPARLVAAHPRRADSADRASVAVTLWLEPPGGIPCRLVLDPATGLPARALRCAYDDTTTLAFEDWREVDGQRLPFRLVESGEDGRADTLLVARAEPAGPAQAGRFARPSAGPPDVRWAARRREASVPFNFDTEHVMVQASVNGGPPLWWLFDTGADVSVVNGGRLAELGLTAFGASATSGGGNRAASAFTRVASLAVGDVSVVDQRNAVLDLGGLERLYGLELGGILGYDFISRFVIVVDYDRHTFTVLPAGTKGAGGQAVPFVVEAGHPHARGSVTVDAAGPIGADFVIDSGAAESANLTAPFVRAHRLLERARRSPPPPPSTTPGMEGQFFAQTSVRGHLRELRVAGVAVHDVPINLQQGTSGAYARASFAGTVGQRVLSRFTNTYDYGRGVLFLAPGRDAGKPFPPRTTFGLSWLAGDPGLTTLTVSGVRAGSPAAEAGFAKGDTLVALDDRPATGLRLAAVQQALRQDGAAHTVDVRHAGGRAERLTFTVKTISIEDR